MAFSVRSRKLSDKTDDPFVVNDKETMNEKSEHSDRKGVAYNKEEATWVETLHDQVRIAILTSLSLYLRIMRLGFPSYITDMELETTRQVNWYMAGKLFIGNFPPLVGILCTGLARLAGYYGTEDLTYSGQYV
jgi:dolichyl-phosphate-mannose--protein O-mannosyl transferase